MTLSAPDASPTTPAPDERQEAVSQFYRSVVDDAAALLEADEVTGLDREISLLRVRLLDLGREPEQYALMIKSVETIAKLVSARYRMSPKNASHLSASLTDTLARFSDAFMPPMSDV